MRKRIPDWYRGVWVLLLVFWIALTVYYHTGSSGVQFGGVGGGATIDFHRGSDYQLYRITDHMALHVGQDGLVAVVDYQRGTPPLTLLCGSYEGAGTTLQSARVSGDWLYGRPVEVIHQHGWSTVFRSGVAAVNLASGETINVQKQAGDPDKDLSTFPPELTARGLTAEAGAPAGATLAGRLKALSTSNEGCENFNWAFLILFALMGLMLPVLLLSRRRSA
jgi:hypothetical protein